MNAHMQSLAGPDADRYSGAGPLKTALRGCTQRVGGLSKLPALIRAFDVDPAEMLDSVGLPADALDDPDARVSLECTGRLLVECATRTDSPHFALLAGRLWSLADWGAVGELARNCTTVGEALRAFNAHQHLASEGALTMLVNNGSSVDFVYAMYVPRSAGTDSVNCAALAANFNMLSELCGPDWAASEVCITQPAPANASPYRGLFRAALRFDTEICAVRFSSRWLDRPIAGADAARKCAAERLLASARRPLLIQELYRTLRSTLIFGQKGGDVVAQNLSMHRRTLSRRLRAQGTTYQEALDDVRFAVATQLLGDKRITLDDIAANLGYASVNTFMRAFARWTGKTPGSWRRQHVQARSALYRRGEHAVQPS